MKSLTCFLLLTVLCVAQDATKKPAIKTEVGPTAPRFQLFVNPNVRADTFLIDTVTGKIWERVTYTNYVGDPDVWVVMDRIDNDEQDLAWSKTHLTKQQMKAIDDANKAASPQK